MTSLKDQIKRTERMRKSVKYEFSNAPDQLIREVAALRCALIDNKLAIMDRDRFVYPIPNV